MSRRKQRSSARRKGGKRPTLRELRRMLPNRERMSRGFRSARDLFLEMHARQRRRRKPPTMNQLRRTVVTILVVHLSDFDYPNERGSSRAGVARMLAASSVRLTDAAKTEASSALAARHAPLSRTHLSHEWV